MYKENENCTLDSILDSILYEDMKNQLNSLPSENEVKKLFPYTQRQVKEARRLDGILKQKRRKSTFIYIKRAAVIILCVITASFGLLLTDEGIRAAAGETLREIAEMIFPLSYKAEMDDVIKDHNEVKGYHEISFDDIPVADYEKAEEKFKIENIEVKYIPEGFNVCDSIHDESSMFYSYRDSDNNFILISTEPAGGGDYTIYSEKAKVEKISVNGNDALFFYNEKDCRGDIVWGNELYIIHIYGRVTKDELIKIAEGIKY